ncbi:MAG: LapA family protein [Acidobacteriota bacterium]
MQLFLIMTLIVSIITVIFAIQNSEIIGIRFLIWKFKGSLALILLISFGLGIITSLLASIPSVLKNKKKISNLQHRIQEMENQLPEKQPTLESHQNEY